MPYGRTPDARFRAHGLSGLDSDSVDEASRSDGRSTPGGPCGTSHAQAPQRSDRCGATFRADRYDPDSKITSKGRRFDCKRSY